MSHIGPVTDDRRLLMLGLDAVSLPFIQENRPKLPVLRFASGERDAARA